MCYRGIESDSPRDFRVELCEGHQVGRCSSVYNMTASTKCARVSVDYAKKKKMGKELKDDFVRKAKVGWFDEGL